MSARYLDLLADDLRGIIAALDAAERGMAPQMAPQVDLGVAAAASESANLKPLAAFQKIGT
jgi:hypothetical protein